MRFIVHEHPVGRTEANYVARADLAPFGLDGRVEQLWLRPVDEGRFEVTCIPFAAYGLNLGDTVVLEDDYVSEVTGTSGHRTLRLLYGPDLPPLAHRRAVGEIKAEILAAGLLSEWDGERFVAVDVPPGLRPAGLSAAVEAAVGTGHAFWEWADAMPFARPSRRRPAHDDDGAAAAAAT